MSNETKENPIENEGKGSSKQQYPSIEELEQDIDGKLHELMPQQSFFTKTKKHIWKISTSLLLVLLVLSWVFGIQIDIASPKYGWDTGNASKTNTNENTKDTDVNAEDVLEPPSPADVIIGTTDVGVDDDAVLGDPNAPITMIEFTDYECTYCQKHEQNTIPKIKEEYIDKGIVKYIVRDFPLPIHQFSQEKAEATECADDQNKFWEMHDKLFSDQSVKKDDLPNIAQELGLDTQRFTQCLDSGKYKDETQNDLNDAVEAGIQGTPGFIINGNVLGGAMPYETFKMLFDELIAKQEEQDQ